MPEKKKNFLSKLVIHSLVMALSLFRIIPNLIFCIELEARLAGKNLIYLIAFYLLAGSLLTSSFLCLSALCILYLISLSFSSLAAIFIVLLSHIFLLIIILIIFSGIKNNLSFSETRRILHDLANKNE